jgi:hypothetical protein
MYTLANNYLEVSILDPIADQERFGVRYCTGGYIFQVTDATAGELMSGPTFPHSFNWFDGQGIPDAFNQSPLRMPSAKDDLALILGVGICDLEAKTVQSFCSWDVNEQSHQINMQTTQSYGNYTVELDRTVSLHDRTIRSTTRLANRGTAPIPLRWFPHPFYPQPDTDDLLKLNIPLGPIEHEGYHLADSGFITRRGWPWTRGFYLALDHAATTSLTLLQKHPKLGLVGAACSYTPQYFPIWGNPTTFSWEPFLERSVGAGQELVWWIDYDF